MTRVDPPAGTCPVCGQPSASASATRRGDVITANYLHDRHVWVVRWLAEEAT